MSERTIQVECGCLLDPTHVSGDRLMTCDHGQKYIVRAREERVVEYTVVKQP